MQSTGTHHAPARLQAYETASKKKAPSLACCHILGDVINIARRPPANAPFLATLPQELFRIPGKFEEAILDSFTACPLKVGFFAKNSQLVSTPRFGAFLSGDG